MKDSIKAVLGSWYTPRLSHTKRQLEVKYLHKGEPEIALLPMVLNKDDVSIDIGANIGDYLDTLIKHSRRVIAFEPHPRCFEFLTSINLNGCTLVNMALSDQSGTATLKVPLEGKE